MFRVHRLYILVLVATVVIVTTVTATTQNIPHIITNDDVLNPDIMAYAVDLGIDYDTANYQLQIQDIAGDLDAELMVKEGDTFAGLWIQHTPQFQIVAQFTQNGEETIHPYIENSALADIVEVRTVDTSLIELVNIQAKALRDVGEVSIPVESGINVFQNHVELYITERFRFDIALQEDKIQLSDNVRVITVDELSANEAWIYAGLALSECTSGFSVEDTNGVKGIVTSAHCSNALSYNGTNLVFKGAVYGGSYDFQWHTAPGYTVKNWVAGGGAVVYGIYSTKHRDNQALSSWVCKYGKTSGYTCGYIIDKNYMPTTLDASWSPTFIRVHRDGIDLSSGGDSGGPWFRSGAAYGIHKSGIGDDAVYMAINYISYLGLTVFTNLTNQTYLPLILNEQNAIQTINTVQYTDPYPVEPSSNLQLLPYP